MELVPKQQGVFLSPLTMSADAAAFCKGGWARAEKARKTGSA
jgi:hypothetical protein